MNVPHAVLARLQTQQDRVRNICILAHVDHGKTTLSDNLIAANGIINPRLIGEMRYLDSRDDEQERGITMKSSSISLLHIPAANLVSSKQAALPEGATAGAPSRQTGTQLHAGVSSEDRVKLGYLINLIDSPGHVDFCSEVSSAARLSDGALVVVDAVEGVCIQTHAVLKQAWQERVAPCLVINKMDRLVTEIQLTPLEAFERMQRIVDEANQIMSSLQAVDFLQRSDDRADDDSASDLDWYEDEGDEKDVFHPGAGNVMFGSAVDGWAFTIQQFSRLYATKFGFSIAALNRALWGQYAFSSKHKRIIHMDKAARSARPMFVQFILEPLWKVYSAAEPWNDARQILGPVIQGQKLTVSDKAIKAGGRSAVQAVMRAWLPLAEAALTMAVTHLPSPKQSAPVRVPHLLSGMPTLNASNNSSLSPQLIDILTRVKTSLETSSSQPEAPLVIYISKMVAVPASTIPLGPGQSPPSDPNAEVFLAFGRVYSGVLRQGQRVHVLSPAYNPSHPERHRQTAVVTSMYLMMGRALERLGAVPAGNVLAIAGLHDVILKSATVSNTPACPPLAPMIFQAAPIVQVAVEPALPDELVQLERGLQLLNRADPFVEIRMADTGEWVIGAAGEVHLETCIKDLRERFARIELIVSAPLVNFRESVVHPSEVPADAIAGGHSGKPNSVVEASVNDIFRIRVRAHPLPEKSATALEEHVATIGACLRHTSHVPLDAELDENLSELHERLADAADAAKDQSMTMARRAWMFGPHKTGPNILMCHTTSDSTPSLFSVPAADVVVCTKPGASAQPTQPTSDSCDRRSAESAQQLTHNDANSTDTACTVIAVGSHAAADALRLIPTNTTSPPLKTPAVTPTKPPSLRAIESGISAGFHMATCAGPLCEDQLWGVAFELEIALTQMPAGMESFDTRSESCWDGVDCREDVYGPLQGRIMTGVAAACRRAVDVAGVRLVEAQYLTQVATGAAALSASIKVIKARRGRIINEEMREGVDLFIVTAYMPVEAALTKDRIEGGGDKSNKSGGDDRAPMSLADELRRESSGAASASLVLSHWERLQIDPFWKPVSEQDREVHGETGILQRNLAKMLVNVVRSRKGLPLVDAKVVDDAQKQRTRARKV